MPGELRHLVPGNHARLLDLRRTPVHVTQVLPGAGFFEVEIDAFEDARARWLVPVEDVGCYQFEACGAVTRDGVAELEAAAARHDVQVTVTAGDRARRYSADRLRAERARADAWLAAAGAPAEFDPRPHVDDVQGWPEAARWLAGYLASRGVADLEQPFAAVYVSNPWAGDLVLAHLTVMAELGLGPLTARAIRDPEAFDGGWNRARRAEHIIARSGFVHALWARADRPVAVYRGVGIQDTATGRRAATLPVVAASLSRHVAESHFGSASAAAGALYRQRLQPCRLFMSFLETEPMNRQYQEAEAVLLAGSGPLF